MISTFDLAGPDGIGAVGGLEDQAGGDIGETALVHLEVSCNGGTLVLSILTYFNRIVHYKPSNYWGTPIYRETAVFPRSQRQVFATVHSAVMICAPGHGFSEGSTIFVDFLDPILDPYPQGVPRMAGVLFGALLTGVVTMGTATLRKGSGKAGRDARKL